MLKCVCVKNVVCGSGAVFHYVERRISANSILEPFCIPAIIVILKRQFSIRGLCGHKLAKIILDARKRIFISGFKTKHQTRRCVGSAHQSKAIFKVDT